MIFKLTSVIILFEQFYLQNINFYICVIIIDYIKLKFACVVSLKYIYILKIYQL